MESLARAGFVCDHRDRSRARVFCRLVGDPEDWEAMPLAERLAIRKDMRRVVTWCYLTQRISGGADYLVAAQLNLGRFAATLEADFHAKFTEMVRIVGRNACPNRTSPGELGADGSGARGFVDP